MSKFIRSERERMGGVFSGCAMQRGSYSMRSRFMRSLKKESMESMDGGLVCLPSFFRSRWMKLTRNRWERMGTDELTGGQNHGQ